MHIIAIARPSPTPIYGFTYPAEAVFRADLNTGETQILAYIGNATMMVQLHNAVVDKEGCLWGTYAETPVGDANDGSTQSSEARVMAVNDRGHFALR